MMVKRRVCEVEECAKIRNSIKQRQSSDKNEPTKNGEATPSSRWAWARAERDSRAPATGRQETISAKALVLDYNVLTSGEPSKSNRSLPIGPGKKLVVY